MEANTNTVSNNNIFMYAFLGALLFSAAVGFTVSNFASIAMLQLPFVVPAAVLGISSLYLLYKAVKSDQQRLKWPE